MKGLCFGLVLVSLFFCIVPAPAQTGISPELPFTMPQTIFVGDLGRMVVPLGRDFSGTEPFIVESPERLNNTHDLLIRRIELERRGGGVTRLLIDFIPFATGFIPFPDIQFYSLDDSDQVQVISGLQVYVSSILTPAQMALSEPAPPLAVPGTSLLVYGTAALVFLVLFFGIGGSVWGRRHLSNIWEYMRKKFLVFKMKRFIKQINENSSKESNPDPVSFLSLLSGELREFLTLFTGINCRSLTSGEFLELPIEYPSLAPVYLSGLFQTWDNLRFSGRTMEMADLTQALGDTEDLLESIEKAEREKGINR